MGEKNIVFLGNTTGAEHAGTGWSDDSRDCQCVNLWSIRIHSEFLRSLSTVSPDIHKGDSKAYGTKVEDGTQRLVSL